MAPVIPGISREYIPLREEQRDPSLETEGEALAANGRTIAAWTLVSRATGLLRMAIIAGVLGPTYFANLFQTVNLLPIIAHELLTGSLISAALVPSIANYLRSGDRIAARELACGFLGAVLAALFALGLLCLLFAPVLLNLVTFAVSSQTVREQQHRVGWPLLAVVIPQLLLYGVAAVGSAVQNAHCRFRLAAAAPAFENLGVTVTVLAFAVIFGPGSDISDVGLSQVLFLGIGSTVAVALHATAQWWGAYRAGVLLLPRLAWWDPDVRQAIRMGVPAIGYTALSGASFLGLLVVAGTHPGGAVAFQIGLAFYNLAVAIGARPAATAQLPVLAGQFDVGDMVSFGDTYRRALALTMFVALPATMLFLAMPETLARAVSVGAMGDGAGVALVASSIASVALGVIGQSAFIVATSASYARRDAVSPLLGMVMHAIATMVGMALALGAMEGTAVLWTIGLCFSGSNMLAAAFLHVRLVRALPKVSTRSHLIGNLTVSAVAVGAGAGLAAWLGDDVHGQWYSAVGALAPPGVSGICYLGLQWVRGSDELRQLLGTVRYSKVRSRSQRVSASVPAVEHPG
jgi:putative peptidoglycan lipid II flippase